MTIFDHDQEAEAEAVGRPVLIRTKEEPDWAHVWGLGAAGHFEPLVDFHLTCGRGDALTVNLGSGITRHLCRACLVDSAKQEGD